MTERSVLHLYGEIVIHGEDGSTTTITGGRVVVRGPSEGSAHVLLMADEAEAEVCVQTGGLFRPDGLGNAVAGLKADAGLYAEGFPAVAELLLSADEGRSVYRREAEGSLAEVTA